MKRPCNKCKAKGWYRTDISSGARLPCSRCQGSGQMDRVTKAEKRARKAARA